MPFLLLRVCWRKVMTFSCPPSQLPLQAIKVFPCTHTNIHTTHTHTHIYLCFFLVVVVAALSHHNNRSLYWCHYYGNFFFFLCKYQVICSLFIVVVAVAAPLVVPHLVFIIFFVLFPLSTLLSVDPRVASLRVIESSRRAILLLLFVLCFLFCVLCIFVNIYLIFTRLRLARRLPRSSRKHELNIC